ncbi:MAG TPA: hypothetical protein VN809_16080 [Telmatospirillum sp.]|nr:hypothetical protein [Telmatospirillum sp.]
MFARLLRLIAAVSAAATLSACVAGQSIDLKYQEPVNKVAVQGNTVSVQVKDERPYVTNADKTPYYIGHYRAGFGNTWDVTTEGKKPLADLMTRDLGSELTSMGFQVAPADRSKSQIEVLIREWNFDTYINGKFWYLVEVNAKSAGGMVLSQKTLKDQIVIEGDVVTGAKYAFEEEMPKIYNRILRAMIRDNSALVDNLQRP